MLELLLDSKWKPLTARALNFSGYPSAPNGYGYKVITAGTSGATEPVWPTTINNTVADGSIVWTCVAAVPLVPPFEMGLVNGVAQTIIKSLLIGDATITNAKIHDLAADKITAGKFVSGITITDSLSALNADLGVITSGFIRSPNSMRYINLNATGAQRFLSLSDDSGVTQFWVAANGMGYINQGWLSPKTDLVFNSSGTWVVPAWCSSVVVDMCGGGGGGGKGVYTASRGGGGNSGVNVVGQVLSVTPGATINVYVGNGGSGATAPGGTGGTGGSSSILSVVASGGNGGRNSFGGVAQAGTFNGGNAGLAGQNSSYFVGGAGCIYQCGGGGGASNYGNGGAAGAAGADGAAGGVGAGGGGGGAIEQNGGAGGSGRVVLHY
jgi:hypothetical protein